MKIIAHINTDTPEGRKKVEELRNYPDVVSFEENRVNEPEAAYETKKRTHSVSTHTYGTKDNKGNYLSSEQFWKKVEEKRNRFCEENGIV